MLRNQAGSATLLGIMVMIILVIFGAGLLPWVTNETRIAAKSRDVLEAEYAAEAGAKRMLVEFDKLNHSQGPDFSWQNSNNPLINDASVKRYNVIICSPSDPANTPITPVTTSTNIYKIQSTGFVNGATKVVSVLIKVTGGSEGGINASSDPTSPFYYAAYSGNEIHLDNTGAINGGDLTAKHKVLGTNGGSGHIVPDPGVVFPSYESLTSYSDPNRSVSQPAFNGNTYSLSTGLKNVTLIVDGNLKIDPNVPFENVILYVNGSITFNGGGVNFNGTNFIVANGNFDAKEDINLGHSIVVSYGRLETRSISLNGSIAAEGNELFHGNTNITYDKSLVDTFIKPSQGNATAAVEAGSWQMQ